VLASCLGLLVTAACGTSGSSESSTPGALDGGTTPTTVLAATTTSTTEAPSTTTTVGRTPASGVLRTTSGVLVPLRAQLVDGSGWVVGTPCGGEAVVATGVPVPAVQVVVDPGHGGSESGSVSGAGLWESRLNLDVSLRVEQVLRAQGVSVELTRRDDRQVTLASRAELARSLTPQVLVSVHHNGGHLGASDVPGTLVFHQVDAPASRRLAGLVNEELVAAFTPLGLQWVAGIAPGALAVRNEQGTDYYGVLRGAAGVPSVIVEALYLTGPDEAAALERDDVRQAEAEAIGRAVVRFLTTRGSGSGFRSELTFGAGAVPTREPGGCIDPSLG